ncbi:CHAT domain-containing protein [Sphingopyxis panaciterrulae]|uniref:CHAT domain-containing protein n=2 Tax=Sphingopyxis TaxID=165697 RepID=A0A7W9B982_9SPHN|nr:CHAT domain-containing protein [Sphingopyxis panaciterrulae]MBB5708367.1 hypothetical protein [Sphingopyxis panaciterrulae]
MRPEIDYFVVIPEDDPWKASPFQGFSFGITEAWNLVRAVASLPADVLEPALPIQAQAGRRTNGVAAWRWNPAAAYAIDGLAISAFRPFWVMMTCDRSTARKVDRWIASQAIPPLHISEIDGRGRIRLRDIEARHLLDHFRETFELAMQADPTLDSRLVREGLEKWAPRPTFPFGRPVPGHNVVIPNLMSLEGVGYAFIESEKLLQEDPADYRREIAELADFVLNARSLTYSSLAYRTTPPQPDIYITAPSLYSHIYKEGLGVPSGKRGHAARALVRMMQRQTGYRLLGHGKVWRDILDDEIAMGLLDIRRREVSFQTVAAGLAAAGTLSATVRLPSAVNRANGSVRQMSSHARSDQMRSPRKLAKTFGEVQFRLAEAVGPELLRVIASSQTGVKLVADAPLEWLPINGLPLGLCKTVSRITTTPGNLQIGLLARTGLIHLSPDAFRNILIISALAPEDPISAILLDMIEEWQPIYGNQVRLRIVKVATRGEFIAALNAFQGAVMIFDGHGGHDGADGVATLRVGRDEISIWDLKTEIRIPPIVILSACDTQAADRSHATTANAFLAGGAVTVLGSLLPVDARDAAMLVARLIWRLAEFLPAVTGKDGRAHLWSEVVAGMLRLHLILDLISPLLKAGSITSANYHDINVRAITATTNREDNWWDDALHSVAAILGLEPERAAEMGREVIAASDAIRYIQLGNPELIVIKSKALLRDEGYDI